MTRPEDEQVVTQDAFSGSVGGPDWIELAAPEIHVVRRAERRARNPLSYTRLVEFLECPACCQVRTEGRGFRIPETEEMMVGLIFQDLVADFHRPIKGERIRFKSPLTLLLYMRRHYPGKLEGFEEGERLLDFLRSEEGEKYLPSIAEASVRYLVINKWAILERAPGAQVEFVLSADGDQVLVTSRIDQVRKKPIGEIQRRTPGRKRKFKRRVLKVTRRVGEDRSKLNLQTGIQLLAYNASHSWKVPPEAVVYELETGKRYVKVGENEELLKEGLVWAKRAMDLGFDEQNPSHEHYSQLEEGPEMEAIAECVGIMSAGKEEYEAAKRFFEAYSDSCQWEEIPSPVKVRRLDVNHYEIVLLYEALEKPCFDCDGDLYMDLDRDGTIRCVAHGRLGKFSRGW